MFTMMGLGSFRFGLDTAAYQSLERQDSYRWESQARLGRHPASQWIGEDHRTIDLEGAIYPQFRSGMRQLDTLRELAGAGVPYFLVSGYGKNFGRFTIESIREGQTIFWPGGAPKKQDFTVALRSYGEDGVA